jgi:hypothetical protein
VRAARTFTARSNSSSIVRVVRVLGTYASWHRDAAYARRHPRHRRVPRPDPLQVVRRPTTAWRQVSSDRGGRALRRCRMADGTVGTDSVRLRAEERSVDTECR